MGWVGEGGVGSVSEFLVRLRRAYLVPSSLSDILYLLKSYIYRYVVDTDVYAT